MSIDTVNQALTTIRVRIGHDQAQAYSKDGKAKLLTMLGTMRYWLMGSSPEMFDTYIDNALASMESDAMSFILDELFAELGFPEGVREQLSAELAA